MHISSYLLDPYKNQWAFFSHQCYEGATTLRVIIKHNATKKHDSRNHKDKPARPSNPSLQPHNMTVAHWEEY